MEIARNLAATEQIYRYQESVHTTDYYYQTTGDYDIQRTGALKTSNRPPNKTLSRPLKTINHDRANSEMPQKTFF